MNSLTSGYQKEWLRFDAVAGLTTAAVVIPKSMAFAIIAGLPVLAGLYVAGLLRLGFLANFISDPVSFAVFLIGYVTVNLALPLAARPL